MKITYIDIHTHLNLSAFSEDWKEAAKRAQEEGVALINVGTQRDTSAAAVEIADATDGVYATIGIHPVHATKSYHDEQELGPEQKGFTSRGEEFDHDYYAELAKSPKVVAVGECGLDYYRVDKDAKEKQEETFIRQIEFANEIERPLMLHVRASQGTMDAYEDALVLVKRYAKVRGNVHFFAGSLEVAKQFWDIGYSTSFTGVLTFTHDYDAVVQAAPKELIHAETDAPYVAPVPHRGERNEPLHVREVYKKIAELRGEDEEVMRAQLVENASNLFGILI
ncbi:TatD family hydrolase [Candidatus Kaiserbacteria bacterium]|nr:TatD family hydrolase [Candidatus Kaiserbacteria bacterium]